MQSKLRTIIVSLAVIASIAGCGPTGDLTIEQKRDAIVEMERETLLKLYEESPETAEKISNAVAYGTFSNANVNLMFGIAGSGYGSVVDNSTGKRTYMKMASGAVGLGLGARDYRVVMIFTRRKSFEKFLESGWSAGAQADATAKSRNRGGALSGEGVIRPGIKVYSMTEAGLALQASVGGQRYWKDQELN